MTIWNIIALMCSIIAITNASISYLKLKHVEHIAVSIEMPLTNIILYSEPLRGRIEGIDPVVIRKLRSLGVFRELDGGKIVKIIGTAGKDVTPRFFIIQLFGQKWIIDYHDVSISDNYVQKKEVG